jgi:hypothetical protein
MAFLRFRRETVETKQPEQPARSNEAEPPPAEVREPTVPDVDARRAQATHDESQPIEEPGYGHGV